MITRHSCSNLTYCGVPAGFMKSQLNKYDLGEAECTKSAKSKKHESQILARSCVALGKSLPTAPQLYVPQNGNNCTYLKPWEVY